MDDLKILRSKNIYTACSPELTDGYVVVRGRRIEAVVPAEDRDSHPAFKSRADALDCGEAFIMPAFNDYHVHMALAAMMEYFGTIRATACEEEAAKILFEKNKDKDPAKWILGGAWDHFVWPGQKLPSKDTLDRYFPNTPVFSLNKECHGAWLNSAALKRFGIAKDTPDPPHGSYFRDADGEPTGYVHELAVAPMLSEIFSEVTDDEIGDYIKAFAETANRLGIASVADLPLHKILREGGYRAFCAKYPPSLRIHFSVAMFDDDKRISALSEEFDGEIIRFNGVKDFLDGTPMGYTGYLTQPYADRPGFVSEPIIPREALFERVRALDEKGVRIRLHCCGDGAVRLALDAFEHAGKRNGLRDLRHAIEHIEVISPEDVGRFAKLGVIASVQPEHNPRTHFATHPFHHLIGAERMRYAWAFRSIAETGAHLAFGTDYPVVEFTPFKGLFRAVNRLTNELEPIGGFNPAERLSMHESLRNYTFGSAFAAGRESELGTLEAGKLADIAILERNPFEVASDRDALFGMEALATMMNGEFVFER
ncbi:MAG: amidohydrolase [Clostridiales Family XIII bacterium]|jgi:predicted amidohydrolase YtcJ|nr:amidohydrolase [Clostridiales Family XIII bacterium]